jgi:hypothetical protein
MLSTHLHLSLPRGLFLSYFSTNNLYTFLFSQIRATYPPSHPHWLDYSNFTWQGVQIHRYIHTYVHRDWFKYLKIIKDGYTDTQTGRI